VEIITIFPGIPDPKRPFFFFAQSQPHQGGGASQAYHIRRAEDETALAYFDLKPVHLDFPDCIYRGEADQDDWYYISDDDIFGSIHPAEAGFPAQIARAIENEINHLNSSKPQETLLYAPPPLAITLTTSLSFWQRRSLLDAAIPFIFMKTTHTPNAIRATQAERYKAARKACRRRLSQRCAFCLKAI